MAQPGTTLDGDSRPATAVDSRPWPAGLIVCESVRCDNLITEVHRDKRGRLHLLLGGVAVYARQPLQIVCPKCGHWRVWNPSAKYHRGRWVVDTAPDRP